MQGKGRWLRGGLLMGVGGRSSVDLPALLPVWLLQAQLRRFWQSLTGGEPSVSLGFLSDSFSWKWLPSLCHPVSFLSLGKESISVITLSLVVFV